MRKLAYLRDEYRTTLFKRKLREIIGAPWLRFYYSKGGCHLCITVWQFKNYREVGQEIANRLKQAGIEFKIENWWDETIYGFNIPIDQEALPERSKRNGQHVQRRYGPSTQEARDPSRPKRKGTAYAECPVL